MDRVSTKHKFHQEHKKLKQFKKLYISDAPVVQCGSLKSLKHLKTEIDGKHEIMKWCKKTEAAAFYADRGQLLTSDQIWAFSRQLSPDFLFVFWPREVAYNSIMSCRRETSVYFLFLQIILPLLGIVWSNLIPGTIAHMFHFPENIFSLQKVFYHYPHTAQSKARLGFEVGSKVDSRMISEMYSKVD